MHHPTKVKKGFNKQPGRYTEGQAATAEVQNQQTTMCQFYGWKKPTQDRAQKHSLNNMNAQQQRQRLELEQETGWRQWDAGATNQVINWSQRRNPGQEVTDKSKGKHNMNRPNNKNMETASHGTITVVLPWLISHRATKIGPKQSSLPATRAAVMMKPIRRGAVSS